MITILCPVKKTVWGPLNNLTDLKYAINKSGQPFGVDWSGPACNVIPTAPCDKTYYQYLGFGLHGGIDLPVASGTPIYAAHNGSICEISDKPTQGLGVVIYDAVQRIKTVYWHLLSFPVKIGDRVKQGDLIGLSDNTGYSTGNHLHFELKLTDDHGVSQKNIDPLTADIIFSNSNTNMKITKELLPLLYQAILHRTPDTDFWVDHDVDEFLRDMMSQVEYTKLDILITDARNL
jgi:murein DD-endopeptidase MepM/ murein hydrolase activator NlpD